MKKFSILAILVMAFFQMSAQNTYWVFFTDKNNTHFNPYQYFDAKAIERYNACGADLYDITNYPVNGQYSDEVQNLTTEYVGTSRWLNAVAVTATDEQIRIVEALPFVARTQLIATEAVMTETPAEFADKLLDAELNQIALMQGEKFQKNNINGKGVRIAVFDGGFPDVDTHPAFKHLRDNHQIIKTWNFASNKENVYCNNSHGRMVLSCIAGIMNDTTMLGLAPGAEFLLARTEIEAEKKKEEIWWVEALEWADQNGAHIVSSSLGYGIQLHDLKDMDGRSSIVAKGASTAASKGILVCTAMGNEGTDKDWKMLVTPADADGVLSVGAVRSLEEIESYSSFGPTADGRRKPNVVACGYDMVAQSNGNYSYSQGTSFATPMVSGFAACVKQMHPEWTATQLLEEIEKSGNHYPYYDYAFGYGVPQAGYFTDKEKAEPKHSFDLAENADNLYVVPVNPTENRKLFYNIQNGDGSLEDYFVKRFKDTPIDSNAAFSISKYDLTEGQTVNIWYNDQYAQYVVGKDKVAEKTAQIVSDTLDYANEFHGISGSKPARNIYTKKGNKYNGELVLNASFMIPTMWSPTEDIYRADRHSRSFSFSYVNHWQLTRVYGLGFRIGFGSSWYAMPEDHIYYGYTPTVKKYNFKTSQFDLEFHQRFVLTHISKQKLYVDLGVYGDWITGSRLKYKTQLGDVVNNNVIKHYNYDNLKKLNCGVRMRLGLTNFLAIYGQYRITSIMKQGNDLPKWEIGFQIF